MTDTDTTPTTGSLNILNLEKFKNTCLFSITIKKWGNRAQIKDMAALQAYIEQLKAEPDQNGVDANSPAVIIAGDRVKSTKVLIKSKTYAELCRDMTDIKTWVLSRCMPSMFRAGMFVIRQDQVGVIEKELRNRIEQLNAGEGPLAKFLAAYPADIEAARSNPVKKGGLGPIFRASDYPRTEDMPGLFDIEWYWLALSVPENIPDELKAEAGEKFKRRLMDAAEDIEQALRVELQELLEHAEERLTTEPGEKPKVFRDSLVGNLISFIETFDSKNVFGDYRLAGVVAKAKSVLVDDKGDAILTTDKLRKYASVRDVAKKQFADIRTALDGMIQEKATRKFDFEE